MGDIMRPVPFEQLLDRMFTEYRNHGSIFGISKENFYKTDPKKSIMVFDQKCATALGPAAGPHTQLAQNIISAYLVGGRFMELKTVQIMDYLGTNKMISKPCIDARDEGHNVEWSTEYTLEKAYDEYLKAWFAIHLLQTVLTGKKSEPDFIFNMSVGYNLEGIKQPKMQTYINSMMDATLSEKFDEYRTILSHYIEDGSFCEGSDLEGSKKALKDLASSISPRICSSVCVSTMHGCPPKEIEAICTYMLTEKHLNTFVKLNPTLLGYDSVREILDDTGFEKVVLKRETFEHDLQYPDAVVMLKRLKDLASSLGLGFGVKLTNTLANVNCESVFEGDERYMSGRALLPISTRLAAMISKEFDGKLAVSYSGGATAFSVKDIFDTGIRPITLATDMLKPGGYSRLRNMAQILEKSDRWNAKDIDVKAVTELSENARKAFYSQRDFRGDKVAKVKDSLPLFDCYVSPCMQACPICQDIPDYISLVGQGRYAEALALIYDKNALPNITCNICDHQCQNSCARMDYEGPVQIRKMKKAAVEKGSAEYYSEIWEKPQGTADVKAAVVGAGPAGLSAAFFLSRAGFDTTVLEKAENAGGVVANIIPKFRIDEKAVLADIRHVEDHGVRFRYSVKPEMVTVSALKAEGFDYIFYAVGSESDNEIPMTDRQNVIGSLSFLENYRKGNLELGKHVVVTGGGNTAMDCARAASRCEGVEDVSVVYRRTEKEMPCDPDEFELAKQDGIQFFFLSNPKSMKDSKLVCTKMALGEPGKDGRRKPVETDEVFTLDCTALITAVGEHADTKAINALGLTCDEKGWPIVNKDTNETETEGVFAIGDMASGPSTVVRCIASARKAVETVIDRILSDESCPDCGSSVSECTCGENGCSGNCSSCSGDCSSDDDFEKMFEEENDFFRQIQAKKTHICTEMVSDDDKRFEKQEASRCMDCQYLCNKCVDVCPNRANVAIDMRFSENTEDPFQIVHIDAFCNECGNCASFCNHMGRPYKDKFTVFSRTDDFEDSTNSGFVVEGQTVRVRLEGKVIDCRLCSDGTVDGPVPGIVKDIIEEIFLSYDYLLSRVDE